MDHTQFERQMDRLARYFRHGKPMTNDQKTEWWQVLGHQDLEDLTRGVGDLIKDGTPGRMPPIRQAEAAMLHHRHARLRYQRPQTTLEDIPASSGFARDAKLNLLRLFRPVRNARGKVLPQFTGDAKRGLTPGQQALQNLYALADRHQVDTDQWAFMPDGDPRRLQAYGRAASHMAMPRRVAAPSADDLALLNPHWVDNVFKPTVEQNLKGD